MPERHIFNIPLQKRLHKWDCTVQERCANVFCDYLIRFKTTFRFSLSLFKNKYSDLPSSLSSQV